MRINLTTPTPPPPPYRFYYTGIASRQKSLTAGLGTNATPYVCVCVFAWLPVC